MLSESPCERAPGRGSIRRRSCPATTVRLGQEHAASLSGSLLLRQLLAFSLLWAVSGSQCSHDVPEVPLRAADQMEGLSRDAIAARHIQEIVVPKGHKMFDSRSIQLIHIPKTGGTSLENAFKSAGVHVGMYAMRDKGSSCVKYHLPPGHPDVVDRHARRTLLYTIRNPYSRAVSAFRFRAAKDTQLDCTPSSLNEVVVTAAQQVLLNPCLGNCHWMRQVDFFYYRPPSNLYVVLWFERLKHDFTRLAKMNGRVAYKLPHDQGGGRKCTLGVQDLNSTAIEVIQSVYKADFELLGYSLNVTAAHHPPNNTLV